MARFTPRGHALGTCLEEEHVPPVLGVAARGTASCARGAAEPASAAGGVQPRPRLGAQHPLLLIPELGGGPAPRSRAVCSPPHPGPRHLPHRTAGQREPSTARGGRLAQGSWANPPCHTGRRKKEKLSQEEHRLRLQTCAALGDLRSGPAHVQREGLAAPMAGVRLGGYTPRPFPTLGGCGAGHGPGPPEAEQDLTRGRGLQTSLSSDFPGGRSWPVW